MTERIATALFRPVDLSSRVAFRILFSGILLWEFWRFVHYDWIRRYWIQPAFHFKYYGFEWVDPVPGEGMVAVVAVLAMLAVLMLIGLFYRVAAALFFIGFTYLFLMDQARYLNHFYLVCLLAFLMIFVPANRMFALDALKHPAFRSFTAPAWSLWMLRMQVGVVYFYGGLAKLNHDWLRGIPIGEWVARHGDTPLIGPIFVQPWSGLFFAYTGLLIDLGVVPLLLWRRTRALGFAIVVAFNVANAFLFSIGIFPWMMIAATTIFFEPDWPRRLLRRLRHPRGATETAERDTPVPEMLKSPAPGPRRKAALIALGVYTAIQLLLPFRHWLYPGSVHWTEEGHRFAWHMKLRNKVAQCWFVVEDPAGGDRRHVYPNDILEPWQGEKMCTRPDMILQFAHHLAERAEAEGTPGVAVRAQVFSSLHRRPFQPLVDAKVDLARQPRNLATADWIVPMKPAKPASGP